jgi:hypothetical protein
MSGDRPVDENVIDFAARGDEHRQRQSKKDRERSQASRMAGKAWELADLFHDSERIGYATIPMGDHRETWAIRSQAFKHWITQLLFEEELGSGGPPETVSAPSGQAVRDAVGTCEALAIHKGRLRPVYRRIAGLEDGRIVVDLANDAWEAIIVGPDGWTVVSDPPVRFLRSDGVAPLPYPEREGSLDELRPFLNLASADGWPLIVGWLVMTFRPRGPYPVLALSGEQGTAKSTVGRILRSLVDPSLVPDRTAPRDERDLAISARNSWIVNLDNLSALPVWLSDALARLATGAGLSTRQLYTDTDEVRFYAQRPTLINGITSVITRGDLLDRSILVELAPIPPSKRQTESELWAGFESVRPRVLGALLDAVSVAIAQEKGLHLTWYPRMADFARWVVAAEPALGWTPGVFMAAYDGNRSSGHELALDVSPVAVALRHLLSLQPEWEGTAAALLDALTHLVDDDTARRKNWPSTASVLGDEMRRLAPSLRAVGVTVEFRRSGSQRTIRLARVDGDGNPPSSPSPAPEAPPQDRVAITNTDDGNDGSDGAHPSEDGRVTAPPCTFCRKTMVPTLVPGRFVCTFAPGHPTRTARVEQVLDGPVAPA